MGHYLVSMALQTLFTVARPTICISLARTVFSPAAFSGDSKPFAFGNNKPATKLNFPRRSAFIRFSSSSLRRMLNGQSFGRLFPHFPQAFPAFNTRRNMADSFNRKLFTGVCFGSDLLRFMTIKKKGKERKTKFRQSAMHLKLYGLDFLFFFFFFFWLSQGE